MTSNRLPPALWLILAVALALRMAGAWRANLTFDERAHLALAQTIDLHPGHVHLVSRTLDHPLLSIYVFRLSGLVFGMSDFGLRLLHVLAGTATVAAVFFLARRVFSEKAGLWAAALLAVDQFHASWSRIFMPEVLMLLLATLALVQFLRTLQRGSTGNYVLLGALLGLTYLAKEPGVLLLPVLWLYLAITPEHRRVLGGWRWYLAHAVFLTVVAPDVLWNLAQSQESYLLRDTALVGQPWQLSLKPLSLYVGEIFQAVIGPDVLDPEYVESSAYACYWPAGVLYLAAVAAALRNGKTAGVRLLLVAFGLVFAIFLVLPGGTRFDPFWWASLSLIPAVACAGWLLGLAGRRAAVAAAMLGVVCLGAHCLAVVWQPGRYEPRATVADFAADFLRRGDAALARGDWVEAQQRFIYVLNIAGPNADAYRGLGLVAEKQGQAARAKWLRTKSREVTPHQGPPGTSAGAKQP